MTIDKIYHRNGVSGLGFNCWLENGSIAVEFSDCNDGYLEPIVVPLAEFDALNAETRKGKGRPYRDFWADYSIRLISKKRIGDIDICVFEVDKDVFIGVYAPEAYDGCVPFAAFQFDKVKDGNLAFGDNSWRGDRFYGSLVKGCGYNAEEA